MVWIRFCCLVLNFRQPFSIWFEFAFVAWFYCVIDLLLGITLAFSICYELWFSSSCYLLLFFSLCFLLFDCHFANVFLLFFALLELCNAIKSKTRLYPWFQFMRGGNCWIRHESHFMSIEKLYILRINVIVSFARGVSRVGQCFVCDSMTTKLISWYALIMYCI